MRQISEIDYLERPHFRTKTRREIIAAFREHPEAKKTLERILNKKEPDPIKRSLAKLKSNSSSRKYHDLKQERIGSSISSKKEGETSRDSLISEKILGQGQSAERILKKYQKLAEGKGESKEDKEKILQNEAGTNGANGERVVKNYPKKINGPTKPWRTERIFREVKKKDGSRERKIHKQIEHFHQKDGQIQSVTRVFNEAGTAVVKEIYKYHYSGPRNGRPISVTLHFNDRKISKVERKLHIFNEKKNDSYELSDLEQEEEKEKNSASVK